MPEVIDITNLVGSMKKTWIRWATDLVVEAASSVPVLAWLKLPVLKQLFAFMVEKIVTLIADGLEMQAFFLNTAFRKASQAKDYVDAVSALAALPNTASNEEYENAEKKEMQAFRNFVLLVN